jgi:glutamate dehydrogenase (NAD(P)+)
VGSISALLLERAGCRVVAVSDVHGAIYNPAGLSVTSVLDHVHASHSVVGFPAATLISNEELLTADATVVVPAALEGVITPDVAATMRCRVVVEGANGPTTPDADLVLRDRRILLVPDILANAGGVVVSYFEWVQDLQAFFWEESDINQRLENLMRRAYDTVHGVAEAKGITLRQAAYSLAVDKVARATIVRGIYP